VLGHNMGFYYGWGPTDERVRYETQMRAMLRDLFDWTAAGALKPHVSHVLTLDEYREAMRLIREREAQGKVVIAVGESP